MRYHIFRGTGNKLFAIKAFVCSIRLKRAKFSRFLSGNRTYRTLPARKKSTHILKILGGSITFRASCNPKGGAPLNTTGGFSGNNEPNTLSSRKTPPNVSVKFALQYNVDLNRVSPLHKAGYYRATDQIEPSQNVITLQEIQP